MDLSICRSVDLSVCRSVEFVFFGSAKMRCLWGGQDQDFGIADFRGLELRLQCGEILANC